MSAFPLPPIDDVHNPLVTTEEIGGELMGGLMSVAYRDRFGEAWTEAIAHRKAQLGTWVTFRGAYTLEQTGEIYAHADWTVVPSIWWENRPLVIEESLMSGVPLIVSDIGGMAELVSDASRGRTCRPNDAVHLAETMIDVLAASPPTVRYRAATTAAEHLELYRSCLGPR